MPGEHGIIDLLEGENDELISPIEAFAEERGTTCEYFLDGRDGSDRWGTPYRTKQACGTGWDGYVCPLYVSEACPGCKNKGNRAYPCYQQNCGMNCGECGGGGETLSMTMGYCGQQKSEVFNRSAIGEMGGSLRLDRHRADPPDLPPGQVEFPASWFPVVEWGGRKWMHDLADDEVMEKFQLPKGGYPMVGTTMKTVYPGRNGHRVTPLRTRLGDFEGTLLVNGLTKDDLLDDVWEDRKRVIKFCKESGVDIMVTPQYSAYPQYMNFMMVFNTNRVFTWYSECIEAGFKHVALDVPPNFHARWILEEYFDFIARSGVKIIALSYQQFRARGGMDPRTVWNAKLINKSIPKDVSVIIFGPSTPPRMATMLKCFEGRRVIFSTVEAYARSAFFQLIPFGTSAPPGMGKNEVFCRNVHTMRAVADKTFQRFYDGWEQHPMPGKPRKDLEAAAKRREERARKRREDIASGKVKEKAARKAGKKGRKGQSQRFKS